MSKKIISLLVFGICAVAFGQTSADLSAKYPRVFAYWFRPDVLMTAKFAPDGQACKMTLQKPGKNDSGTGSGLFFSQKEIQSVIDDLAPQNQRGRNLTRPLNETIDGSFTTIDYTYENLLVHVSRLSWKWRKRSSDKIAERTYEERTQALHC